MKNFFDRVRRAWAGFMAGRYGNDQLNRFLIAMAFFFAILSLIFRSVLVFHVLVWILLVLCYFRMFSRNIQQRYNENTRYLQIKEKIQIFFDDRFGSGRGSRSSGNRSGYSGGPNRSNYGSGYRNGSGSGYNGYGNAGPNRASAPRSDAEHRIFRCPQCDQRVRVPRGRGKIAITCPKCGHEFIKRS